MKFLFLIISFFTMTVAQAGTYEEMLAKLNQSIELADGGKALKPVFRTTERNSLEMDFGGLMSFTLDLKSVGKLVSSHQIASFIGHLQGGEVLNDVIASHGLTYDMKFFLTETGKKIFSDDEVSGAFGALIFDRLLMENREADGLSFKKVSKMPAFGRGPSEQDLKDYATEKKSVPKTFFYSLAGDKENPNSSLKAQFNIGDLFALSFDINQEPFTNFASTMTSPDPLLSLSICCAVNKRISFNMPVFGKAYMKNFLGQKFFASLIEIAKMEIARTEMAKKGIISSERSELDVLGTLLNMETLRDDPNYKKNSIALDKAITGAGVRIKAEAAAFAARKARRAAAAKAVAEKEAEVQREAAAAKAARQARGARREAEAKAKAAAEAAAAKAARQDRVARRARQAAEEAAKGKPSKK